jgi:hypothetical protein
LIVCGVSGLAAPDLVAIELLLRLRLAANCLGYVLRLRGASQELLELVVLIGFDDIVDPAG